MDSLWNRDHYTCNPVGSHYVASVMLMHFQGKQIRLLIKVPRSRQNLCLSKLTIGDRPIYLFSTFNFNIVNA